MFPLVSKELGSVAAGHLEIPRWYAVRTRSRFEKAVDAGVESYLPLLKELSQWKDRKKFVALPVFPGYVFARFVDEAAIRLQVLQTHGVVQILGQGRSIEPVLDCELESIRRLIETDTLFFTHPFLRKGAWVRVKHGPLRDIEGRLVCVKNQTRLILSVEILSQSVATEVDANDVEVIRLRE